MILWGVLRGNLVWGVVARWSLLSHDEERFCKHRGHLRRIIMASPKAASSPPPAASPNATYGAMEAARLTRAGSHFVDEMTTLFSQVDLANDGQWSLAEFQTFMRRCNNLGLTDEQVIAVYEKLLGDDGVVSKESLLAGADFIAAGTTKETITIIVPSTQNVADKIDTTTLQKRVETVAVFLSRCFGGATVSPTSIGYYVADDGRVVRESVVPVVSYTTPQTRDAKQAEVLAFAEEQCRVWSQECVAVVISGAMQFVGGGDDLTGVALLKAFYARLQKRDDYYTIGGRIAFGLHGRT